MKRPVVILFHLVYWFIYLCLLTIFYGLITVGKPPAQGQLAFWNTMMLEFALIPALIGFYACYTILFTRFLAPRKIFQLILSVAGVAVMATAVGELLMYLSFPWLNWVPETFIGIGVIMALNAVLNGIAGLGLRSFVTWYRELKWKEELAAKTHEMELALVRSQLNPHFLFNTINNIDVLIGQDAAAASGYLNRLSDIMRFMLYETKAAHIPLEKELAYIGKYLELQKIRTANADYVRYAVQGDAGGYRIAPMVFIPFIENAFKHAMPKKEGTVIDISIIIDAGKILFECANFYTAHTPVGDSYNGLGNELIEKRLMLLYPATCRLQVSDLNDIYKVALSLPLL